jgi:hypothetical protein
MMTTTGLQPLFNTRPLQGYTGLPATVVGNRPIPPLDPQDIEDRRMAYLIQQGKQNKLAQLRQRFIRSDVPISLFAGGLAYLLYKNYNPETQVVKDLAALSAHRDSASKLTGWLVANSANRPLNQSLVHPESVGTLGRVQLALSLGGAPEEVMEPVRLLKLRNPSSMTVQQIEREAQGYATRFRQVVTNATGMEKLAIPVVSKTLGVTPEEVKSLVRQNPYRFLKNLMSKGLTNPRYNPEFFTKLFSELNRASNLMTMIVAGSTVLGLVGVFLTRYELVKKRGQA